MIRQEYKDMLIEQRSRNEYWGGRAARNAGDHVVQWLNKRKDIHTVLDFGCGLGTLGDYVQKARHEDRLRHDLEWTDYDPSVPGVDAEPTDAFDAIISTDVLEHIEPVSLDSTLEWMRQHSIRSQFHHIDFNDCKDVLLDGRSVHLIVEDLDWWEEQLVQPGWGLMYSSNIVQRKRGRMRASGTIIIDRG